MDVLGIDPTLNEASWCWIDTRVPNVFVWQMATGKFWEILAYVTTVILYTSIKCFLIKKVILFVYIFLLSFSLFFLSYLSPVETSVSTVFLTFFEASMSFFSFTNSVDPHQKPQNSVSDMALQCLPYSLLCDTL